MKKIIAHFVVAIMLASLACSQSSHSYSVAADGLRPAQVLNGWEPIFSVCSGDRPVSVSQIRVSGDMNPGVNGDAQFSVALFASLPTQIAGQSVYGSFPLAVGDSKAHASVYQYTSGFAWTPSTFPSGSYVKNQIVGFDGHAYVLYDSTGRKNPITLPAGGACMFVMLTDSPPANQIFYMLWDLEFEESF